jgi:hypothetical protein
VEDLPDVLDFQLELGESTTAEFTIKDTASTYCGNSDQLGINFCAFKPR